MTSNEASPHPPSDAPRRECESSLINPAIGWRLLVTRAAWAVASLLLASALLSFALHPIGWAAGTGIAAIVLAAALSPYRALLLLAALGPLSTILFIVAGIEAGAWRLFEAMVLAFLTGWAAQHALWPSPLAVPPGVGWSAAILLAAALGSGLVSAARLLTEQFGELVAGALEGGIVREYAIEWGPVSAAMLFAEGLLLLLAAADLCARDVRRAESVQRMMVIGAAAAALFNVRRIVMVSMARDDPWAAFQGFFASLRVNVHHGDWNAAGSYFAMMLCIAVGLAARDRMLGAACAMVIATSVWMSGSRAALAAVFVTGAAAGLATLAARGRRRTALVTAGAGFLAIGLAIWALYPAGRNADPSLAFTIRLELAKAALAMAADHPWFGVGLGRFYELSQPYTNMPIYVVRENAHNNFLQILAELGIPGLALFLVVVSATLIGSTRLAALSPASWGLVAGLSVFLLTCLGGHPLLVPHAAYPFWLGLGLAASLSTARPARPRIRNLAIVLMLLFAVTVPFRGAAAMRDANVEHTSIGFSRWQREPDGTRYRWAGGRSTFFLASSASWVRIPLQRGGEGPDPIEVRILLNGREADRVLLTADHGWRTVRLLLGQPAGEAFARIDLEAGMPGVAGPLNVAPTDTGGVLRVGRPILAE